MRLPIAAAVCIAACAALACTDPGPKPAIPLPQTATAGPTPTTRGPQPTSILGDGLWAVGLTIGAGTYVTTVPDGDGCEYARYSDRDGRALLELKTNMGPGTFVRVNILRTDGSFRTTGCGSWLLASPGA